SQDDALALAVLAEETVFVGVRLLGHGRRPALAPLDPDQTRDDCIHRYAVGSDVPSEVPGGLFHRDVVQSMREGAFPEDPGGDASDVDYPTGAVGRHEGKEGAYRPEHSDEFGID